MMNCILHRKGLTDVRKICGRGAKTCWAYDWRIKGVRRIITVVSAVLLLAGILNVPTASAVTEHCYSVWNDTLMRYNDFDIEHHWANEYVADVTTKEITIGYPDGTFRADANVSYGEYIKMVLAAAGVKENAESETVTSDIAPAGSDTESNAADEPNKSVRVPESQRKTSNWASEYYYDAIESGYFTKYDISYEMLNRPAQRKYLALIAANVIQPDDLSAEEYERIQNSITDVDFRSDYEYETVIAYSAGVFKGYENGTFQPDGYVTRAEAAAVLSRLSKLVTAPEKEEPQLHDIHEFMNIDDYKNSPVLKEQKYCFIDNEYPYEITMYVTKWDNPAVPDYYSIIMPGIGSRSIVLVKDGKIIRMMGGFADNKFYSSEADYNVLKTFDYIGVYSFDEKVMRLIPNPFK